MKGPAAVVASLLLGVTLLPVVIVGGDSGRLPPCGVAIEELDVILATIRRIESGDNYAAQSSGSTASGAYQFIDSTWDRYDGYLRAVDAPPDVQDAKAAEHVIAILDRHRNDVAAVPVVWYLGHFPSVGSPLWDLVPHPNAGNVLTPRQYQTKWLATHQQLLDAQVSPDEHADPDSIAPSLVAEPGGCDGVDIEPLPGGWSLPGPRHLIDANPRVLDAPHHTYPAWDWMLPTNTPIYAVRGGTVTAVRTWGHNWYEAGCTTNSHGCDTCGIGLTITDDDNHRWTYCHGTNVTIGHGAQVIAGQQIMWSGNSGRSGAPHLHLEIRTTDGRQRCPQQLLRALYEGIAPPPLTDLRITGCYF